jgi:hypothetical protein
MAVRTGFEPATYCVTGNYANRYTTGPLGPRSEATRSISDTPRVVNTSKVHYWPTPTAWAADFIPGQRQLVPD